jgi:hypothetical protein
MKKTILLSLYAIIIGMTLNGQCVKKTYKDDMTGNVTNYVASGQIKVKEGPQLLTMYLKQIIVKTTGDTVYSLEVTTTWLSKPFVIGESANMILKLSNDSLMTLRSATSSSAKRVNGGNYWELTANYLITPQQISILTSGNLMKLRMYGVAPDYLEFNVKEKFVHLVPEMAKCFLAK